MGEGVLTIGTTLSGDSKTVIGYVADTGCGIPDHLLDNIFQPYFTTKEKGKGTGLGLAIIRSIIEAHNGQIKIISSKNSGTRVAFIIPIVLS